MAGKGAPKGTKQRTQLQIISEILAFLQAEDRKKTAIVYATGVNFRMATKLLAELKKRGMVDVYTEGCYAVYWLTPAGEELLGKLKELEGLL